MCAETLPPDSLRILYAGWATRMCVVHQVGAVAGAQERTSDRRSVVCMRECVGRVCVEFPVYRHLGR